MIQASKSIGATVKFAVFARILGILLAEAFEVSIENIESGEQSPALASVRLMLSFFRMPKQGRLFRKCLHALNAVIRGWCQDTTMARGMWPPHVSVALNKGNEGSLATWDLTAPGSVVGALCMHVFHPVFCIVTMFYE